MTLTRAKYEQITSRGRIFCDLWTVAFFFGLSWYQAEHLHSLGRLPRPLLLDGSEYRPSGERLVPADELAEILPEERQLEFERWRAGDFDVIRSDVARDKVPVEIHRRVEAFSPDALVVVS